MLGLISRCTIVGLAFLSISGIGEICICNENAQSNEIIERSWATSASVFGKRYRFEIQDFKLKSAPMWENPEISDPPLSREKAIEISRSQLSKYYQEVEIWILSEIHLYSMGQGYWF